MQWLKFVSRTVFCITFCGMASSACQKGPSSSEPPIKSVESLAKKGRAVYLGNCTACHAFDPSKPGTSGPEIMGSSFELLSARLLEGGYPPGYTPKRKTRMMVAMPHLKGELEALSAYLNAKE